jgi:hypothetical protein
VVRDDLVARAGDVVAAGGLSRRGGEAVWVLEGKQRGCACYSFNLLTVATSKHRSWARVGGRVREGRRGEGRQGQTSGRGSSCPCVARSPPRPPQAQESTRA